MTAFGAIVQWFARHEFLMQGAIAGALGISAAHAAMATSLLSHTQKHDTLKSLLKFESASANRHAERIAWYLGETKKYLRLRNDIAHSVWKVGARPGSIRPMYATARGGDGKFVGHADDERDYIVQDLAQIADELSDRYDQFEHFLRSNGLLPKGATGVALP